MRSNPCWRSHTPIAATKGLPNGLLVFAVANAWLRPTASARATVTQSSKVDVRSIRAHADCAAAMVLSLSPFTSRYLEGI